MPYCKESEAELLFEKKKKEKPLKFGYILIKDPNYLRDGDFFIGSDISNRNIGVFKVPGKIQKLLFKLKIRRYLRYVIGYE